jgi:hypothetical protein
MSFARRRKTFIRLAILWLIVVFLVSIVDNNLIALIPGYHEDGTLNEPAGVAMRTGFAALVWIPYLTFSKTRQADLRQLIVIPSSGMRTKLRDMARCTPVAPPNEIQDEAHNELHIMKHALECRIAHEAFEPAPSGMSAPRRVDRLRKQPAVALQSREAARVTFGEIAAQPIFHHPMPLEFQAVHQTPPGQLCPTYNGSREGSMRL